MSAFNFDAFEIDNERADSDWDPIFVNGLYCNACQPTERLLYTSRDPIPLGRMVAEAVRHHEEYHREPHLMGNGQ